MSDLEANDADKGAAYSFCRGGGITGSDDIPRLVQAFAAHRHQALTTQSAELDARENSIRARRYGSCPNCGGAMGHDYAMGGVFCLTPRCSSQSAELDALREEVVTADHSRTCYARALEKMRIALVNINDGLEDEGDRIYLGSTNHADDIRAAWQIAEALNWDEILEHTQPKTDIAATNFRLQATIAQLRAEVERLTLDGIHTCSDACQRPACVLRRENAQLRDRVAGLEEGLRCTLAYLPSTLGVTQRVRALLTQNEVG